MSKDQTPVNDTFLVDKQFALPLAKENIFGEAYYSTEVPPRETNPNYIIEDKRYTRNLYNKNAKIIADFDKIGSTENLRLRNTSFEASGPTKFEGLNQYYRSDTVYDENRSLNNEKALKKNQSSQDLSILGTGSGSDSDDSGSFIDFSPMIDHLRQELLLEISSAYSELKIQIESLSLNFIAKLEETKNDLVQSVNDMQTSHEDYNSFMKTKITEIEVCIEQAVNECNAASAQRKRDYNDYSASFKKFARSLEKINAREQLTSENIERLTSNIENIREFCKISIALQGQDEVDRDSISLMGYKSKKPNVMSIDKRCLSCAGQSSAVLAAFKIACLVYEPSQVSFKDRKYNRKDLITLQKNVLLNYLSSPEINYTEDNREMLNKTMLTTKQWRPLSVPLTRFTNSTSPPAKTPETENLPSLRRSVNVYTNN